LLIAALSLLTFTAIGGVYYSEWPTVLSVWPLLWWWLAGFLLWRYKGSLKASAIFAVAALFGVTTDHAYGELWSPVCIGITVAVLCCPEITRPVTARWLIAVGNWLGDISYPLYLCHLTIYFLLFRFLPTTWHSIAWVYVGIGLFSAITIRHLWETPAQRYLKSRWNSHGVVATLSEKHRVVQVVTTLTILCLFATNLCMPLYGGQVPVFPPNKAVHSTFSPITPPIKVMALGDSITYGDDEAQPINRAFVDCEGGYRPILWKALSERGYGIKPVGSVNVGSDMSYDWHCEAHPGATTADFLRCLDRWDSNIRTDVILYQLGTNDPGNGISTTETLHNTATLWQRFFLANPHVVLMVATVIPSRGEANPNHDRFAAINDGLRRQVGVWRQHGYNIYLVDMDRECGFTNDDLGIPVGLHPTPSGYRKMAVVWLHHITTAVPLTTLSKKAKTS
jgi:lysophospholipase L1-like esterase